MGQWFSGTSNDEQHEDLVSSFATYFKNYKADKIISQEAISSIELNLTKGNIQGANSVINDALKEIDNTPLNIAVTGESGAGKSSFINALRGVGHEEEDAAPIGVWETTMHRAPYTHPQIPKVTLWDLPGIGTTNFQPKDYLEKVKFSEYDFFIIVSSTRFRKNDIDLAKAIRFMKKDFYFVRTKIDSDLKNEEECKPTTFDREKVLQQIRDHCVNTFKQNDIDEPQIFLISNNNLSEYDFPILMDTVIKDLPTYKRHRFMLSLPNITEAAIERKRESLQQFIWLEAFKLRVLTTLLTEHVDRDVELLKINLKKYRVLFGVDDASLQSLAENCQVPVEQLKATIKSPNLLNTEKNEEIIQEMLSECEQKFSLPHGNLFRKGLYIRQYYFELYFLDTVTDDAKVLLKEIHSRNRVISN